MSKHKHLKFNIYFFIGLSVIITLFFTGVAINSVQNEKVKQQEIYQEKVSGLVESFQTSIENSMMAFEIISGLIEEKLLISSHILTEIPLPYSNEVLKDLAQDLNIDEIYYFDQTMTVLYSSTERLIGWQAYIGHPVYEFYQSDANYLVEDIRKDTEGDNYYKFAYIKRGDGSFLQLAILADNYYRFIDRFESNRQVNLFYNPETMLNVKYISTSNEIRSSTNTFEVGKQLTPNVYTLGLVKDDVLIRTGTYQGQEAVYTYTKVYKGDVYFGTLVVIFNQKDMNAAIDEQVFSIIRQYVVVMLIVAILVYYAYTKNKKSIRLVLFDPLTGLPNYLYLLDELNQAQFSKGKKKKGLIYINVIDFRHVMMTHGYTFGNEVIKEIGARLRDNLEKNHLLFRLQAERFCVIINEYESNKQLELIANNLFTVFSRGFGPQEKVILSAKMSMVSQIESYQSSDQIIQDAIIALEMTKADNRRLGFFKNDMERLVQRQDAIVLALRNVINQSDTKSFKLHYQAEFDLKKETVVGFEALARLSVEGIGNVSPMEFISIAENSLLIYDLGKVIIKDSCLFLKSLENEHIKVSINISGIQLMREEFVEDFFRILSITQTNHNQIIIEVTESVFLDNFEMVNVKLKELRDTGIEIALDDFGTGYSSLSRLKELNIDYVKIDKYFIDRILSTQADHLLTTDIVSIIHKMGYKAIAEGVETEVQKVYLERVGCDWIQGYLVSKPVSKVEAIKLINP